jgi:BASS family bile acid:Na+ symporter
MLVRKAKPAFAIKADKPVRIFSIVVLALISVIAIVKEKDRMFANADTVGLAMLVFNVGSMGIGYYVSKAFNLNLREATAITMEVGIHNATLALYIAMTVLGSFELAIPAALYAIIMFFTAGAFSFYLVKKNKG